MSDFIDETKKAVEQLKDKEIDVTEDLKNKAKTEAEDLKNDEQEAKAKGKGFGQLRSKNL